MATEQTPLISNQMLLVPLDKQSDIFEPEIKRIESDIKEVHELFIDVQHLVQVQGSIVDNIEYNIDQSVDDTKNAVSQLTAAKKSISFWRKLKYGCVCFIVLLILLTVAAMIYNLNN